MSVRGPIIAEGALEEVDPSDVLLALGRAARTGVLSLNSPSGRGEIHLLDGRITRVRRFEHNETLGAYLVRMGVVPPALLRIERPGETLDEGMMRTQVMDVEAVEGMVLEQVLATAARVLAWRKGTFVFALTQPQWPLPRFAHDVAITLRAPMDSEGLVQQTQLRRDRLVRDAMAARDMPPSLRPRTTQNDLLVVDDDPMFLTACANLLREGGVAFTALSSARSAIDRLPELVGHQDRIMLVDLMMPRASGRGLLGGLEILRRASALGVAGQLVLMMDGNHDDASAIAQALGVRSFARRPRRDKDELAMLLNPLIERVGGKPIAITTFDLGRTLAEDDSLEWKAGEQKQDDPMDTLRTLLTELHQPTFDEGIPLLILRFASHFFLRAALFRLDPHAQEFVGMGGFGVATDDPGRKVRAIRIPLRADTYFSRAVEEGHGIRLPHAHNEWNARLHAALGGTPPVDVFAAPLFSQRGLEGVLYADMQGQERSFPDVALLEIFLQQAAAALERLELVRTIARLAGPSAQAHA
jgi:CheY-like chemotaxis protein